MLTAYIYAALAQNCYEGEYAYTDTPLKQTKKIIKGHSNLFVFEDNLNLVLAFEGSDGKSDWKDNFKFIHKHSDRITPEGGKDEEVHRGFFENYMPLRPYVYEILNANQQNKQVSICGHSLGGANSLICRADLLLNKKIDAPTFTFGAPRVGNKAFYDFILASPDKVYQYKNNTDIVTNVPFECMGYWSPPRILIHSTKDEFWGWTPIGNWKSHYPDHYVEALS